MNYPIKCNLHPVARRMLIELTRALDVTQVDLASDLLNQTIVTLYKKVLANDGNREAEPEGTDALVGGQSLNSDALANAQDGNDSAAAAG